MCVCVCIILKSSPHPTPPRVVIVIVIVKIIIVTHILTGMPPWNNPKCKDDIYKQWSKVSPAWSSKNGRDTWYPPSKQVSVHAYALNPNLTLDLKQVNVHEYGQTIALADWARARVRFTWVTVCKIQTGTRALLKYE